MWPCFALSLIVLPGPLDMLQMVLDSVFNQKRVQDLRSDNLNITLPKQHDRRPDAEVNS